MNFILTNYKGKSAVYCKQSKCFVLFGRKKDLKERVKELNRQYYDSLYSTAVANK